MYKRQFIESGVNSSIVSAQFMCFMQVNTTKFPDGMGLPLSCPSSQCSEIATVLYSNYVMIDVDIEIVTVSFSNNVMIDVYNEISSVSYSAKSFHDNGADMHALFHCSIKGSTTPSMEHCQYLLCNALMTSSNPFFRNELFTPPPFRSPG